MGSIEEILEDPSCVFLFPTPEKLSPPLLKIEEGDFQYKESNPIFKGINFGVDMDSRIAIVGANGVNKYNII
jgi:ATP-binding cassette subfamily F protein 3